MKRNIFAAIILAALLPSTVLAVEAHHQPGATNAASSAQLADGEILKVAKETKKITIRHGPIPSLDMPPMTMTYQVKDPALLRQVKAGDKIRFLADKIDGAYTIIRVEPAK
jgi:Cu(I)/Ag(I) efflux system periplasmic protein CusF